jgi:hypothetical protein
MYMKNPNSEPQNSTRGRKVVIRGIGALVSVSVLTGCAHKIEHLVPDTTVQPTHVTIPSPQTLEPTPYPTQEVVEIEKNIPSSRITSVTIFGDEQPITEHRVYRKGNFIDLVPPTQNGIFSVLLPNQNDNPAGYSFSGSLSTDEESDLTGDLLIGGHTNSGDEWVMNGISTLKVGDTQTVQFENALYTTVVTKITHIKKTGDAHAWPGFDKALGEDGAIFGCRLTKDSNGNTVQSGDVTIVGIKIIAAQKK